MTKLVVNPGLKQAFIVLSEQEQGRFTGLNVVTMQVETDLNREVYDLHSSLSADGRYLRVHSAGLSVPVEPYLNPAKKLAYVPLVVDIGEGNLVHVNMPLPEKAALAMLAERAKSVMLRGVAHPQARKVFDAMSPLELIELYSGHDSWSKYVENAAD